MQLPMMTAAERYGEFVADFETQGSGLRKPQMMRIGWLSATDEAGLRSHEPQMGFVAKTPKLPLRAYLAAIAIFCNEVKGKSALALSRDLNLSYKSAFVLLHKLREAMAEELKGRVIGDEGKVAEVDGGYFGGYVKPANLKENRRDRRLSRNQNGKRKVVVIVRERAAIRFLPCSSLKIKPCHSCARMSPRARRSMPMKPALGTNCTNATR
jgi:hypothetical protein